MSQAGEVLGPIVETGAGRVRGLSRNGVHVFRGVPYGATTAGANRFQPPQPVPGWTGIRDTVEFGNRAPQEDDAAGRLAWREWIRDRRSTSEECLVLNIHTPAVGKPGDAGRRPVMVYIHGGGFNFGSGSVPGVDGSILAARGDVVVVTVNHRLNVFGHLHLGDADGGRFADAGNNGVLDIVAALEWVRDNIAAFGGDAGNVTIFGQSGGGSKVAVLMAMPAAKGLFHRAVIQSSSQLIRMADPQAATGLADAILAELGIGRGHLGKLLDVPMQALLSAGLKAVANGAGTFRPVVDGRALPVHPFDPGAPAISADIPLLIGTTDSELTFSLAIDPANFDLTGDEVQQRVMKALRVDAGAAGRVMADYRSRRPRVTPADLLVAISSDHQYRRNDVVAAERKAAQGRAPVYAYLFTWKTPVLGGVLRSPHTMCIPFVFGTVDAASEMLGKGAERYALSERVMQAWLVFARTGNPNHPGLPEWLPYDAAGRPTMIFDDACVLANDPLGDDLRALAEIPLFQAGLSGG